MEARLASGVRVSALLRLAEVEGGFGAVLAKGDATAGAIAVILAERGVRTGFFERRLAPDGSYAWESARQDVADDAGFAAFLERRRRADPDLWVVELDIPSAERFAAEMNDAG